MDIKTQRLRHENRPESFHWEIERILPMQSSLDLNIFQGNVNSLKNNIDLMI